MGKVRDNRRGKRNTNGYLNLVDHHLLIGKGDNRLRDGESERSQTSTVPWGEEEHSQTEHNILQEWSPGIFGLLTFSSQSLISPWLFDFIISFPSVLSESKKEHTQKKGHQTYRQRGWGPSWLNKEEERRTRNENQRNVGWMTSASTTSCTVSFPPLSFFLFSPFSIIFQSFLVDLRRYRLRWLHRLLIQIKINLLTSNIYFQEAHDFSSCLRLEKVCTLLSFVFFSHFYLIFIFRWHS